MQYLAIRYTDRLADEGAVRSVGSRGDSYDNALAETVNGLYKAEVTGDPASGVRLVWSNGQPLNGSTGGMSDASILPWATCLRRFETQERETDAE